MSEPIEAEIVDRRMTEMVQRFPDHLIKSKAGHDYVEHAVVRQRLIHIFGAPPKIEILRELYDGEKLTGIVMRLTVPGFEPVEDTGECDNPQSKTNGARAKDASSDAIKRCAMALGVGLHLWAQENYYLDTLDKFSRTPHSASDLPQPSESAKSGNVEGSAQAEPQPGGVSDPPSGSSPSEWWGAGYVEKYGAAKFCKIASSFSKNKTKITDPRQTEAATEEQRQAIIDALTADEWSAPAKAGAK